MALNMTQRYTKTEVWTVPAGTDSGVAVVQATTGAAQADSVLITIPGVTLVAEGADTKSTTVGPYTISGIPSGGVGLPSGKATVAIDGAFRFPVVGATNAVASGAIVYATVSGGAVTALTLTSSGTTVPFGKVDRFIGETSGTETSVWVGRFQDRIS
jgi:hypothetical protein